MGLFGKIFVATIPIGSVYDEIELEASIDDESLDLDLSWFLT